MKLKTFPKYMYHKDHNEPVRVDSKAEQTDKENLGWTTMRLFKEYPKWIGDKLVQSKAEEERLLAESESLLDVTLDAIEQGPANVEETPSPIDSLFAEGGVSATSQDFDPGVVKEVQVEGQDTAVIEKLKKNVGRPKKK